MTKRLVGMILLSFLLSSCSWFEKDTGPAPEGIAVDPPKVLLWSADNQLTISSVLIDGAGQALNTNGEFIYESEDPSIATVSAAGVVTMVGAGSTNVIVRSKNNLTKIVPVITTNNVVRITGQALYQDRLYDGTGLTATVSYKPIRLANIDITFNDGSMIRASSTDIDGKFDVTVGEIGEYGVRVIAKSIGDNGVAVQVKDLTGKIYAVRQNFAASGAQINADLKISAVDQPAGVYNIYDVLMTGSEFAQALENSAAISVNAYWQKGSAKGTYFCDALDAIYCPQGAGIYVLNETNVVAADTDEFDDDVLWHEFGHFLVSRFSRDDSIGGCHMLDGNDLDLRLAWSEGWGDYFPLAVKAWLAADTVRAARISSEPGTSYSTYIDTDSAGTAIKFDFAAASYTPDNYIYASSEAAIARVLWNINSTLGSQPIWNTLTQYVKTVTPVNLEAFWDGIVKLYPSDATTLGNIFAERKIYYSEDSYEPNNSVAQARYVSAGSTSPEMQLYRSDGIADVDYFKFDAVANTTYTLVTENLRGGTDTYMKIVTAAGADVLVDGKIMESDDYVIEAKLDPSVYGYERFDGACQDFRPFNDASSLASKIIFKAPATGTYYLFVSTTKDAEPYPSAGRYGGYQFSLKVGAQ